MENYTTENQFGRALGPVFRILVSGKLDEKWNTRTHGMSISPQHGEGEGIRTQLVGELQDEAALMGILNMLYNHGIRILRVERMDEHFQAEE